jgi:hypothetical protein
MPRQSLTSRSESIIERCAPDAPDRFIDLQFEVRHGPKCAKPGTLVGFPVGGRWDTLEHRYVGRAAKSVLIEITPGQIELMEAWFTWFRGYLTGDWEPWTAKYGPRPFSFWAVGGRRRGKSWIGIATVVLFAVALAGSFPWIVSEIEDDFLEAEELPRYWRKMVPSAFYIWDERSLSITLINGSRIELRSAHNPAKLKAGESSYVFVNEAQKSAQLPYNNVRGAVADTGSIVFVACNPPNLAVGYWVQDMVAKLRRGEVDGYLKEFHDANPYVVEASLDAMKKEMSAREYAIERDGRFMSRTDIVLHEFEGGERGNVRAVPHLGEITDAFLRQKLGKPIKDRAGARVLWDAVIGVDFQLAPHMAACIERYYLDPDDPSDAYSWTVDEVVIEQGDEDDLVDALESMGYRGDTCAVIADASGEWQQADRKKGKLTGRGSWDMFRQRGWQNIFAPSPWSAKNPLILERVAVANARLRGHDGRQHAFLAPHCVLTAEALSKWPNGREGFPSRRSQYSHIGDAWTYPKYRLWPRRMKKMGSTPGPQILDIHGRDDRAFT